ncbi:MAG TPA: hypothetical protein VGB56_04925, partial [Flavisolibacter sp.]
MDLQIFEAVPGLSVLLLPDAPAYTVIGASNDFVAATGGRRSSITGKGFFEIANSNPLHNFSPHNIR